MTKTDKNLEEINKSPELKYEYENTMTTFSEAHDGRLPDEQEHEILTSHLLLKRTFPYRHGWKILLVLGIAVYINTCLNIQENARKRQEELKEAERQYQLMNQ